MTATTVECSEANPFGVSGEAADAVWVDRSVLAIFPFAALLYSACLPQEMRLVLGGLSIYPNRMVAFALLPWLINQLFRGKFRINAVDAFILLGALWMQISFIMFYGAAEGLIRGGALLVDIVPTYLIARVCIRSPLDFRRAVVLAIPALAFVGGSMFLESVSGQALIRPLAAEYFGALPTYQNGAEAGLSEGSFDYRLGVLRAAGPFSHPILAGLFLASFLPIIIQSGIRGWPLYLGIIASICAVFSISSAVLFSLALGLAFIIYDWVQSRVEMLNWMRALLASCIAMLVLQIASQSGLVSVFIRYTLNPGTGYYRKLIWDFGIRSVERYPWFGIGYTDYERVPWMSNSVDNHWLLLAIRHGFLPSLLFLLACGLLIFRLSAACLSLAEPERKLFVGIAITIFSLVLAGFTVAFFGGMQTWFFMLLAASASLAYSVPLQGPSLLNRRLG